MTFLALSDPTRRVILDRLRRGAATVNELAEPFGVSQQAISKHLAYLERAQPDREAQGRPPAVLLAARRAAQGGLRLDGRLPAVLGWSVRSPRRAAATPAAAATTAEEEKCPQESLTRSRPHDPDRARVRRAARARVRGVDAARACCCSGTRRTAARSISRSIDVRPGGRFHSCIHNPRFGDCWCVGVYREIVRPERIVYTLATADSAGNEIEPVQAGHDPRWPRETLVTVTLADVRGSHAADARAERARIARQAHRCASELAADARSPGRSSWRRGRRAMLSTTAWASPSLAFASAVRRPRQRRSRAAARYAAVNGIRMYYETLRSGARRSARAVARRRLDDRRRRSAASCRSSRAIAASSPSKSRRTVAPATATRRCSFATSADDVAALLDAACRSQQADVFGFSNGASVALQVAIRHPRAVRKLVFASSMTKKHGAQPQLWTLIQSADISNMPQPLQDAFLQVNPDPAKLKTHARQGCRAHAPFRRTCRTRSCARFARRR